MASQPGTPEIIKKPGAKSCLWNYFGVEKVGDVINKDYGICRTCSKKVPSKNGCTSNLLSHLQTKHGNLYVEAKSSMAGSSSRALDARPANQPSIVDSIESVQKYERGSRRWKKLTDAIVYYIAKDSQPLYTVEKPGFNRLVQSFDKRYELPDRSYFSRTALPVLYAKVKNNVKTDLASASYFAATSDLWSSNGTLVPYISYTVHFLNDNWELQNRCLQTKFLPADHTGEVIADSMEETLSMWDLKAEFQVCITTDSGSNVINATKRLDWPRLSCFNHNLHLGVTKSLADDSRCNRALGLCRKVVAAFSGSWKRKRELTRAQLNLNLKQHSLISDCPTRWGTIGAMVKRLLEQEEAVRIALSTDRKTTHLLPTWQDIDVLQSINAALNPLTTLTDLLSGEKYVTVSAVLPLVHLVENEILKEVESDTTLTRDIKRRICQDLHTCYTTAHLSEKSIMILKAASFLDPRFKSKYMSEEDLVSVQTELENDCATLRLQLIQADSHDQSLPPPKRKRTLGSLFKDIEEKRREGDEEQAIQISPEQRFHEEVELYNASSNLDFEEDPLLWRKQNSFRLPVLSRLARKYLCVCATSSSSERLFSAAGNIVTPLRAHLNPDKVEMLTFLSKNL